MGRCVGLSRVLVDVMPGAYYPCDWPVPEVFAGRGRWKAGPLHTFVDDYRQEFYWRKPQEGLMVAIAAGVCTAPDFSVWNDDPAEWRRYQAWRSAMVAGFWSAWGVRVLPVVSFDSGAWEYVAPGSTWAIRSPGRSAGAVRGWYKQLSWFCRQANVGRLVVFGRELPGLQEFIEVPVSNRSLRQVPAGSVLRAA